MANRRIPNSIRPYCASSMEKRSGTFCETSTFLSGAIYGELWTTNNYASD